MTTTNRPRPSPTRRMFVAMLGAAAAAIAIRDPSPAAPTRSTWTGKTRWIGHC
ncbi:MAG: hypothetical protein WKG01_20505 [Kofleriaceae bacterium]